MAAPADARARATALKLLVAALVGIEICVALAALLPWIYPGEDARFALVWGDELGRLHVPSFDGPVPAKHPLTLLAGVLLSPLGAAGSLAGYGAISIASFALAGYAIFRLAEALGGPVAAALATAIALTRPAVLEQLLTAGKDLPFAAIVLAAAAIVVGHGTLRPRLVLALLALAGLIRPEAWLLAGLFWLWLLRESRRDALSMLVIALMLAAPLIWAGLDLILTGDPLQTLHHGQGRSEELAALRLDGPAPPPTMSAPERLGKGLSEGVPGTVGWGVVASAMLVFGGALLRGRHRPLEALGALTVPLVITLVAVVVSVLAVLAGLALPARFLLLAALALVAVAASAARRSSRSPLAALALLLAVAGTALTLPDDADQVHALVVEREGLRELGDGVIALAERPEVRPAIEACPKLAVGGGERGKISLAQTLAALATERDVSDFELGRSQLLRRHGSAFAFGLGPQHPAFGRGLPPPWRALSAAREGPWTFASRC